MTWLYLCTVLTFVAALMLQYLARVNENSMASAYNTLSWICGAAFVVILFTTHFAS